MAIILFDGWWTHNCVVIIVVKYALPRLTAAGVSNVYVVFLCEGNSAAQNGPVSISRPPVKVLLFLLILGSPIVRKSA